MEVVVREEEEEDEEEEEKEREEEEGAEAVSTYICEQVFGEGSEGVYCKDGKGFSCFSPQMYTQSHRGAGGSCV